jgi:hypothetical protein
MGKVVTDVGSSPNSERSLAKLANTISIRIFLLRILNLSDIDAFTCFFEQCNKWHTHILLGYTLL